MPALRVRMVAYPKPMLNRPHRVLELLLRTPGPDEVLPNPVSMHVSYPRNCEVSSPFTLTREAPWKLGY